MGKRVKNRQWVACTEYYGGPADGEQVDVGCIGPDPLRAFVSAVQRNDIPERLQKQDHWYEIDWCSLCEVAVEDDSCAAVVYVYVGML